MKRDRSRPSDDSFRVRLPRIVDSARGVYFRSEQAPSSEVLRKAILGWIEGHVADPLRTAVRAWLQDGRLTVEAANRKSLGLPPSMLRCMNEEDRSRYEETNRCIFLSVQGGLGSPRHDVWAVTAAARALASAFEGGVFDPQTRRLDFEEPKQPIPAGGEIAMVDHIRGSYSIDERGLGWVTTTGMEKFGLPNLEFRDAPPDILRELACLLNGIAQKLADAIADLATETESPPKEIFIEREMVLAARDVAKSFREPDRSSEDRPGSPVRLAFTGRGREGLEPFITIVAPEGFDAGHGVWLNRLVEEVGWEQVKDSLVPVDSASEAMQEAHRKAVAGLPGVKERFRRGLGPGEVLLVKKGFDCLDGRVEFMWVAVNTWKGIRIQGQLSNDPGWRKDLRKGDPVELDEGEVYDWAIQKPDGSSEGGFTTDI